MAEKSGCGMPVGGGTDGTELGVDVAGDGGGGGIAQLPVTGLSF